MYYVYILLNKINKQIYTGSTNDLKKRFAGHNEGKVISTKRYRPWIVFYYEAYLNEKLARLREKRLKHNGNALRELKKRIGLVKSGAGFTLMELLIYMSIVGIALVVLTSFTADVAKNAAHAKAKQEVQQNARLLMSRMTQDIRTAESIDMANSTFNSDQGKITVKKNNLPITYTWNNDGVYFTDSAGTGSLNTDTISVPVLRFEQSDQAIAIKLIVQPSNSPAPQINQLVLTSMAVPRPLLY